MRSRLFGLLLLTVAAANCGPPEQPADRSAKTPVASIKTTAQPLRERLIHHLGIGEAAAVQTIEPASVEVLSGIQVHSDKLVDGIRFRYRHRGTGDQRWSKWTGGLGGFPQEEFFLDVGETLIRIDVRAGAAIDQITFTTSAGRIYGPWGGDGGSVEQTYEAPFEGIQRREIHGLVVGAHGNSHFGNVVNWLQPIDYLPCDTCGTPQAREEHFGWGGGGASEFEPPVPIQGLQPSGSEILSGLQVRYDGSLDALRVEFTDTSTGKERWTEWAGGIGTEQQEFHFQPGEFLIGMDGRVGFEVDQIRFITSRGRNYGPFPSTGGQPFSFETRVQGGLRRRIEGFFGVTAERVNVLGVVDNHGTCGHFACSTGAALVAACDPCVEQICAADPFCCANEWDFVCVSAVRSVCGLSCSDN